ncbi:hypothetical protein BKA65DRAFT_510503 [Rhexocercosporidium sp. MPI-PUGE-AT-0058]|nr:hypothetical protein BKA65DRAFT_510503 [Rhexocercosporidium sp. MPI-PUGE-AT-0058]
MPTSSDFGKQTLKLLGIDPQSHWHFAVDFYSNQLHRVDGGSHALDFSHTVKVRKASLEKQYVKDIQPRLFRGEADWAVVVRHSTEDAASSFTPFEVLPDVPIPTPPALPLAHIPHVNCPPPSGSKPSKRRIVSTGPSSIYGYGGQVEVEKNVRSFKEGALALLGLSNVEGWTFTVDLHDTSPPKSIDVSAATIADRFEKFIKKVPGDPETYPWPVFVRKCAKVSPKELTPPDDLRHYVILRRPSGESYWKLPTPLDDRYGMNQLQDAFFAAMLVHYPLGTSRPPQNVDFNTDLGYGGLEITQEFWDTVTKQFHDHPDKAFAVCTGLPPPSTDLTYGMGIRLAGTHRSGTFRPGDFTGLAKALRELSQVVLFEKAQNQTSSPPTSFRAWFTAEDRENNVDSCIFYYDDNNPHASKGISLADSLRAWFQSLSIDKSTNCIWFRPEWKQFTVIDNSTSDLRDMEVDHTNQTWDATADSSLDSFRDMLAVLFDDDDYEFTENFEITIPQANQRFVINCHTTEESWRKHVFDYFHDNTLIVIRSDGIMCMTDSSEPWGVLDMPSPRKPAAIAPHKPLPVPPKPTPVDRGHHYDHHDNNGNHHGNGLHLGIGNGNRNNNGGAPPPVVQPPHESRRIPGAKPPIFRTTEVPKFDEWMLNHTAQNTLQQRSWTQDQSVIEPGYAPAAPLYGDNLELGITAGSSMPTVFTQHLTPTDIMQLRKENRKLLNHALEREIGCPICNMTFKAYDNDAKAAHYKGHIDQLNSVSTCPICNETWALFTFDQKRNHLFADFAKRESKDIAQFWEGTRCPICNLDLRGKSSEDVTTHIATHVPGALKFCDRCGFDVIACTPAERAHHERACTRHTPIREPEAPDPILCQSCGRERTLASGKTKKHDVCGNGQYCIRCGLNLSLLDVQEQNEHSKRCRVPGGAAGKYCKRCGKKLEGLSALGLASHNNACYRREPTSVAADNNPWNRLSEAVEAQRLKNATELADLRARQTELKAQETAILSREQAVLKREIERNKIDNLFQDFQDLARDHLCQTNLINHSRQDIVDHFRKVHRKDTFGSIIDGNQDMHVHGIASSTGLCPFPGCYENLDVLSKESLRRHLRQHADETLAHYHHHGEKVNNLPACHSAALNASLAEFKRRLPDFREAHAILQNLVDVSGAAGTQHRLPRPPAPKTSAEKEKEEKEHREIAQLENRLGIKLAKEEYDLKHATEAIQKQRSEIFQLRAELVDAEDADPVVEGAPVPDAVIVTRTKVDQAEAALSKAENDEAQRSARVADHIGQQQAALAVRKRGSGYVPDPVNFDHPGELQGGGGGGSSGGGERGEGGGDGGGGDNPSGGDPSSGEDADQTGFLPSPTRPSFKKLPTPRRARSVKGRAPTTGSKRKKASMDDSEDTMPGGFSNLVRSPSKRETKKMRMAGERMRSHEMMRRRIMMAEEPEGEEISEFAAGEGVLSGVPRRATRGMSSTPGAAPRKVGRPRKIVQKDVEDDGFEDVEEEDEELGGDGEIPAKNTPRRVRK